VVQRFMAPQLVKEGEVLNDYARADQFSDFPQSGRIASRPTPTIPN
jgi:hypothetical protein